MVTVNAALLRSSAGRSRYFTWTLSSVWTRLRSGMPRVSAPKYWFAWMESQPVGRQRICTPRPGVLLNFPYDCQPFTIHGSIFSLSLVKTWIRTPLKNQGVFDDTYDG
jgi:hypothetical protein